MQVASLWDDRAGGGERARGWTVMSTLRGRRNRNVEAARDAQLRLQQRTGRLEMMSAASMARDAADEARARWTEGPNVLAFLFAHPDCQAISALDLRGEYFDLRTGDTWDLFFPGYYQSGKGHEYERSVGARPAGRSHLEDWYFRSEDFERFRQDIERYSDGRWQYSGGTDLVLASGWITARGEPSVNWATTVSGGLTDDKTGTLTLSLPEVIERISRDIEQALASPDYGISELNDSLDHPITNGSRDIIINALGGIIAALSSKALGV
jgi:hypothetical protein